MNYQGHEILMFGQYPSINLPSHPKAYENGRIHIHILEAEELLGRSLQPSEVVHHKDEDKLNYLRDNLIVFRTAGDHARFHYGNNTTLIQHEDKTFTCERKCLQCGKLLVKGQQYYCSIDCNTIAQRKIDRPSRQELKSLIRNSSFTELGRKYHVSDNAIRKWCKQYQLPSTVKEIKTYSDIEWELI